MLIDEIVEFCDKQYSSFGNNCGQKHGKCTHPSGCCSGSCYNCLYHVHFPDRAPADAKKEYDCVKMLYHYVCQYSYLYATELLCAFRHEWSFIKDFPYYHILSLGCGGCADLMAFDFLRYKKGYTTPISYFGIDINELWSPIHTKIGDYCLNNNIQYTTHYSDVFEYLKSRNVINANIFVISYFISYLCNTDQISEIYNLADRVADRVINKKTPRFSLLLMM